MTIWLPKVDHRPAPRYRAIAEAISDAIASGELLPGTRLPPQRELAWRLGMTVGTVTRAYELAAQRGLLSGEVGRGTFVREGRTSADDALLAPPADAPVNLGTNMAAIGLQATALGASLAGLADCVGFERLLEYMPSAGHETYRAAGRQWIARSGLDIAADQIVLTAGGQQAIAAALAVLTEPGEPVLAEALTYPGVLDAARLMRRPLEPVAIDEDGLVPDALDEAVAATGARVVVLVPTIQNPTATVMGAERRRAIVEVARRRNLMIVEDDVYGFLLEVRPPPIATLAPERTVYLTSASKCLAPGLRAGWIAAPHGLVDRFSDAVHALSIAQPPLSHEVLRRWIVDGTAGRIVDALRVEVAARQALAAEILEGFELHRHPAAFHVLLHLPTSWRREEFSAAALAKGIRIVPASAFAVGRAPAPHAVRISLTAVPDRAVLADALRKLRDLASGNARRRAVI